MNPSRFQIESYFFGNPRSIGGKILFIKRDGRLDEYMQCLTDVQEFGNVWRGITGLLRGERVSVIVAGIGPSLVGDCVYALNRCGAPCVYSGTCGGLHASLRVGDYFVAEAAVCGDGYTSLLGHPSLSIVPGDPRLPGQIADLLASKIERVDRGITFTTGSVVREADCNFWDVVNACKPQVIEMEASAFYAAAVATGKRAAAYFWVTDLPVAGKSFFDQPSHEDIRTRQIRYERAVSLDIELLSAI